MEVLALVGVMAVIGLSMVGLFKIIMALFNAK